jgi:hypothetical protein
MRADPFAGSGRFRGSGSGATAISPVDRSPAFGAFSPGPVDLPLAFGVVPKGSVGGF